MIDERSNNDVNACFWMCRDNHRRNNDFQRVPIIGYQAGNIRSIWILWKGQIQQVGIEEAGFKNAAIPSLLRMNILR